jgi:hypothetical protein
VQGWATRRRRARRRWGAAAAAAAGWTTSTRMSWRRRRGGCGLLWAGPAGACPRERLRRGCGKEGRQGKGGGFSHSSPSPRAPPNPPGPLPPQPPRQEPAAPLRRRRGRRGEPQPRVDAREEPAGAAALPREAEDDDQRAAGQAGPDGAAGGRFLRGVFWYVGGCVLRGGEAAGVF